MEQWQIEALQVLLATNVNEVEPGQRVYISSQQYGNSRYHLIDKRYDGVQVEQADIDEKWNKRVNLYADELPQVLKTLLATTASRKHDRISFPASVCASCGANGTEKRHKKS